MKAIIELQAVGFAFTVQGEKVSYRWTRPEPPDPEKAAPLLAELKAKRRLAREYLMLQPGNCDSCPACGHWDGYDFWRMGPGRYCFFSAMFRGKPARPAPIAEAQKACQKVNEPDLNGN